jgi:hypothetical protein
MQLTWDSGYWRMENEDTKHLNNTAKMKMAVFLNLI